MWVGVYVWGGCRCGGDVGVGVYAVKIKSIYNSYHFHFFVCLFISLYIYNIYHT